MPASPAGHRRAGPRSDPPSLLIRMAFETGPSAAGGRPRLLLVEDHEDTGVVFKKILEQLGYDVVLATSVRAAIASYEESSFDAMISDIGLPDGTGWEVMRHVAQKRLVPAIAMSALCTPEDIQRSMAAGFRAHLAKPMNFSTLGGLLHSLTRPAPT